MRFNWAFEVASILSDAWRFAIELLCLRRLRGRANLSKCMPIEALLSSLPYLFTVKAKLAAPSPWRFAKRCAALPILICLTRSFLLSWDSFRAYQKLF